MTLVVSVPATSRGVHASNHAILSLSLALGHLRLGIRNIGPKKLRDRGAAKGKTWLIDPDRNVGQMLISNRGGSCRWIGITIDRRDSLFTVCF